MIVGSCRGQAAHRAFAVLSSLVLALGLVATYAYAEEGPVELRADEASQSARVDGGIAVLGEGAAGEERAGQAEEQDDSAGEAAGGLGSGAEPAAVIAAAEPIELVASETESTPTVSYRTHVQTYGNQPMVADGAISGTTGEAKRLEAVWMSVGSTMSGGIEYRTHVQSYGWQNWVANGAMSGTSGQAKRLEAVQIRLTGELVEGYDVWYRVHAQRIGWMAWAKNGEVAGTSALAWRLEALQVLVVPKGRDAPDDVAGVQSAVSFAYMTIPGIAYRTHVQTYGWQGWAADGAISGTSGQSKRLEALEATLDSGQVQGGLRYRTHVQTYGWQGWAADGAMSGTEGQAKRLEAIRIELTGEASRYFDVWYRVHVQNFGWQGWAADGEAAGTEGLALRLEAIEIRVLPKGAPAPGSTYDTFRSFTTSGDTELDAILARIINTRTGRDSDALRRGYDYVASLNYTFGPESYAGNWQSWSKELAKEMYYNGHGNCYCYASLMTWIGRALGYDIYPKKGEVMLTSGWGAHCWCELNQGGMTYILDCERQKFIPSRNFFMVTYDTAPVYYRW